MDVTAELRAPHDPPAVFAWIEDLSRYPQWLSIVPRAVPEPPQPATGGAGDDERPAWRIDLRGKIGPLSRSKRLRMVRTRHEPFHEVVFERDERDGHAHAAWRLTATIDPVDDGSLLTMRLHYGGRLWEPLVERLLRDEIERSRTRLLDLLAAPA